MPHTATNTKRPSMFDPLISITNRFDVSTASESTRRHVVKQNGLVKILDKKFTNTAQERLLTT
jgi:hypothetical protein